MTVYAVGQALERNPEAARAMADAGWEVIGHGWRWIDYLDVPEEVEREHVRRTNETIERLTGQRPVGWYTGRMSERTQTRSRSPRATCSTTRTPSSDELPYWVEVEGDPHLVVPYTLDCNDFKFLLPGGFADGESFHRYLIDTFEQLHEEGGRADERRPPCADRRPAGPCARPRALPRPRRRLRGRLGRHARRDRPALGRAPSARLTPSSLYVRTAAARPSG